VGDPPQAGFNASQNDRLCRLEARADQVGVRDDGAVRAPVVPAAGGEIVGPAGFSQGGVVGNHGIDAPAGNAPEELRLAQPLDVDAGADVGLGENAHAAAGLLQQASDGGRPDEGAVDVSVSRDEDDIEAVPSPGEHLLARRGQESGIPAPAARGGRRAAAAAGHDSEGGRVESGSSGDKPESVISP